MCGYLHRLGIDKNRNGYIGDAEIFFIFSFLSLLHKTYMNDLNVNILLTEVYNTYGHMLKL